MKTLTDANNRVVDWLDAQPRSVEFFVVASVWYAAVILVGTALAGWLPILAYLVIAAFLSELVVGAVCLAMRLAED